MNKHTTDLERSKKLKELGWEKPTLFMWYPIKEGIHKINDNYLICEYGRAPQGWDFKKESYPAPIASEILEELPEEVETKSNMFYFELYKFNGVYTACYQSKKEYVGELHNPVFANDKLLKLFDVDTPANALADMWIYLKENKLI